jgi:predicted O-methyltransferase YrrM
MLFDYGQEYQKKTNFAEIAEQGYGAGFPLLDSMLLYFMIRTKKPKNYLEIGSGVSTYHCLLAAKETQQRCATHTNVSCIDPYPHQSLIQFPQVDIVRKQVQDVDIEYFSRLGAGDILFIDSTHVVKLDGDVPYLYLEVLPRLKKGVIIHVHDIHFPYNSPYPAQYYVFGTKRPVFWTEAMLLQAFLSLNEAFRVIMSVPLIRYSDEQFLRTHVPIYEPISLEKASTHAGSIWIEKVN